MVSLLSLYIGAHWLQNLEINISKTINSDIQDILFYYHYIDDIILAAPQDQVDEIFRLFNSHEKMKFTIEHSDDERISFLGMRLMIEDLIIRNS